jgi:hypothetical protein
MEPENVPPGTKPDDKTAIPAQSSQPLEAPTFNTLKKNDEDRGMLWIYLGEHGLRSGWSAILFVIFSLLLITLLGTVSTLIQQKLFHAQAGGLTPLSGIALGVTEVLSILGAGALLARFENRSLLDYNLIGPDRCFHFLSGLILGFLALSGLVGSMAWGGWLRFGPIALGRMDALRYAAAWGVCFLLVGLFEEGSFRGYLQFTLTRGMNFWWAFFAVGGLCLFGILNHSGQGAWGIDLFALLGLVPCWLLQAKKVPSAPFWQTAWVTSTLFGFIHISNNGENWIGIFAAALAGFFFCASVRLTGSLWWAIGFHCSWDWAETYFYGTADSGLVAGGHLLTTIPTGNVLYSGGANGPEGSLLALPVFVLLLIVIFLLYGRKKVTGSASLTPDRPNT